jgi:ubiquinone/menaquinone biosynthesis C-methylase UbiE
MDDVEQNSQRERAVAAYYDRLAPVYGEGEYFRVRRAAVLAAIGTELADARAVLDLGCGNGAYAGELAARAAAARIVGADLSPEMLRQARRRLGARIPLLRADATALPFRQGSFDLVFMSHVLLLVPDIERCVAEVSRCLTPGGCLVATVGTGQWREMLRDFLGADAWPQLEALFGRGLRAAANDETRAATACARAGLQSESRRAAFTVGWPAVEEWVRIRWLTIVDDAVRAQAERLLAQVRARATELSMEFAETLLVARKPRRP